MPKIPNREPEREPGRQTTFLEYVLERVLGPPAYRGPYRSSWVCPFHDDHNPSFCTRPHKPEFKDRFNCFGCGAWGDEADFLKLYFPDEDYSARLERLRVLRQEYEAAGLDSEPQIQSPRGLGSTAGVTTLWALLWAGRIDHDDLLEVVAELNHRRELAMDWERLSRKKAEAEA